LIEKSKAMKNLEKELEKSHKEKSKLAKELEEYK